MPTETDFRKLSFALLFASLLVLPVNASAGWTSFGKTNAQGEPRVTLSDSGFDGATLKIDFFGMNTEVVETEQGSFTKVSIPGCGVTTALGQPRLPLLTEHLKIPVAAEIKLEIVNIEWEMTSLDDLKIAHPLFPAQPSVPKIPGARETMKFAYDQAAYDNSTIMPATPATLGDTGQMRAHKFIEVEISPLSYAPATGQVKIIKSIELRVIFKNGDRAATKKEAVRYASVDFDTFAARQLKNFGDLVPLEKEVYDLPASYLIITHNDFLEGIEPFAELKRNMGFHVTVTSLSDLSGSTTGAVEAHIQDAYDNGEIPPTFVLLVGDTNLMPCFVQEDGWDDLATDLYYTTMDGVSDWQPDIFIGRFSCDNQSELEAIVNKTIAYSTFDLGSGTDWIKKATFMASDDNNDVSEGTHNYTISTWMEPNGYESFKRYCVAHNATSAQVIGDLNAGVSQITYSGHGAWDGWYDGPEIGAFDVISLSNTEMWPVVQSYACDTGKFMEDDCFAETWTCGTSTNGGVAFYGSSVSSLWEEDDILQRGAYDAWFGESYNWLRGFLNEGMWEVYEFYSGDGYSHQYYEQFNLFGDPSLDPWTEVPAELTVNHEQIFHIGDEEFIAQVLDPDSAPVQNALVSIFIEGIFQNVAYTDAGGNVTISMIPGPEAPIEMEVHATAHNFIPYSGTANFEEEQIDTDTEPDGGADSDSDGDTDGDSDGDSDEDAKPFHPGSSGCGCYTTSTPQTGLLGLLF